MKFLKLFFIVSLLIFPNFSNCMETSQGQLEVICGPMFSGKTTELICRLNEADANQKVLTIKHQFDQRKSKENITSHNGKERPAIMIDNSLESLNKILELASDDISVIGIDEVQFFPEKIVDIICQLVGKGKRVIVGGLDLDFRCEPFGIMPLLLAIANQSKQQTATCVICKKQAHFTQRIINGQPAKYDDPIILVGAEECYQPRCGKCFQIDKISALLSKSRNQ